MTLSAEDIRRCGRYNPPDPPNGGWDGWEPASREHAIQCLEAGTHTVYVCRGTHELNCVGPFRQMAGADECLIFIRKIQP